MKYLKVSQFLENQNEYPFLLGAFFSRYKFSDDKSLIYTLSTYKVSKLAEYKEKYISEYLTILNNESELKEWYLHEKIQDEKIQRAQFYFALHNDLGLSEKDFFNKIYRKVVTSTFFDDKNINDSKCKFIRAFFELRGSIDTKIKFISSDYFYNDKTEIRRAATLIDNFNIPESYLNFNFRSLQPDYVTGKNKRNDQIRINLYWYLTNIGLMNPYKIEVVKNAYKLKINDTQSNKNIKFFECEAPTTKDKNAFESRVTFFINSIYEQDIDALKLKNLREELKFDKSKSNQFKRDGVLISYAKENLPNECASCKNIYDIKDRSFKTRENRYYTEIHHFISIGKNKDLDELDNLAKLCPACHRALGKGSSKESYQKELIERILKNNQRNFDFASMIFETNDTQTIVDKVYEHLK